MSFITSLNVHNQLCAASGAMGRVTLSSQSIALNQSVSVEISSLELVPDTDIAKIIVTTFDLPSNRKKWKLISHVKIIRNTKTKSFKAHFQVRPRTAGEFQLPDLPARWQTGNGVMKLGSLNVRDSINIGNEDKSTPSELISVGGFAWDLTYPQLLKKIGKGEIIRSGDYEIHTTNSGLEL
ncbi:MAG: hypothetical protein HRU15_08820, partial [Planctomycetes bacterium]|nr:hypothetical protein [Planctomycetota bacterium]